MESHRFHGKNGTLLLTENGATVIKKEFEESLAYNKIKAIEINRAGLLSEGFICLIPWDGIEYEEYTIYFDRRDNPTFDQAKSMIEINMGDAEAVKNIRSPGLARPEKTEIKSNGWIVGFIGFILLMIVICNLPSDSKKTDAPSYSRIQQSSTSKAVQSKPAKAPPYSIFDTYDTSHGAAARITLYIRAGGIYNKEQVFSIIREVTDKYIRKHYDIIWLEIAPPDAKSSDWLRGLSPVACKTKWISPNLDPEWHTTGDGFRAEETRGGIGIIWNEEYLK